jgi:hypothetical protein
MAYTFDQHSWLREAVKGVAASHGVKAEVWEGKGQFIGTETREEGRRAFDCIISNYESAPPGIRGRDVSGRAGGDHRRAGQAEALTGGAHVFLALLHSAAHRRPSSGCNPEVCLRPPAVHKGSPIELRL